MNNPKRYVSILCIFIVVVSLKLVVTETELSRMQRDINVAYDYSQKTRF